MFFTRTGNILAHLIFWFGAFKFGVGFLVAFGAEDMETSRFLADRWLSAETTGEAIDEGALLILLGVALGVLCEIGSRRAKSSDDT